MPSGSASGPRFILFWGPGGLCAHAGADYSFGNDSVKLRNRDKNAGRNGGPAVNWSRCGGFGLSMVLALVGLCALAPESARADTLTVYCTSDGAACVEVS